MDAREPNARCSQGRAAQRARQKKWWGAIGGECGARSDSASGNRPDEPARCITAAGHGRRELCWICERLVAIPEEPGKPEAARYHGQRDHGFTLPDGGVGSASRQRGQAVVEGKPSSPGAGARSSAGNRDAIRYAAFHDVALTTEKSIE